VTVLLRSGIVRLCAGAAGVLSFASADADAQRGLNRPCTAPQILIAWPKAPDKKSAQEVRDKVWSAIKDFGKDVCPVPKESVDDMLTQSKFPTDSTLTTREWLQLGNVLRADHVLELQATPSGRSYELKGKLTLVRDDDLNDSLPKIEIGESMSITAKILLSELKRVLSMMPEESKCYNLGREGKFAEAEAAGRKALSQYPGNIARLCLATVLFEAKKNPDEVLALTEEVRKKDPNNMLALTLQLNTYQAKDDQEKYAEIATHILTIDPGSLDAETMISNLVAWKKTDAAIRLLDKALSDNPEDPVLRRLEFRLVYASENWKEAQKKGEALSKLDTAVVDTAFVMRMVSAYSRDSAFQQAAEWLARGTQKWPENVNMAMGLAQLLRQLGETEQAIAEYTRVLKLNPDARLVRLYIADVYDKAGQPDSAYAWIRRAAEGGDDKAQVAQLVYTLGAKKLNAVQKQEVKTVEDWKSLIPIFAYADSLNPQDKSASFYWGVAAFQVGYTLYMKSTENGATPTCPPMKEAKDYLLLSNEKVRAGAMTNQQTAAQILTNFGQVFSAVESVMTQLKCTDS
jgi:tetratricopeptide (TPR) repeat protein